MANLAITPLIYGGVYIISQQMILRDRTRVPVAPSLPQVA
jgi:hypothetical protein